jgi:hypothetical protein
MRQAKKGNGIDEYDNYIFYVCAKTYKIIFVLRVCKAAFWIAQKTFPIIGQLYVVNHAYRQK